MPASDLKDRLGRAADGLEVTDPPVRDLVRRGRRRFALRIAGSTLSVLVLVGAITWSIASLTSLGSGREAGAGLMRPVPVESVKLPLGVNVTDIAALDGSVYAVGTQGGSAAPGYPVYRIDPAKNRVSLVARVEGLCCRIYSGAGFLWVLGQHSLFRLDPATGRVQRLILPGKPTSVVGDGTSLWITTRSNQLLHVPAVPGEALGPPIALPGSIVRAFSPQMVVAGGDVWMAGGGNGTVIRVRASDGSMMPIRVTPAAIPDRGSPGDFNGADIGLVAAGIGRVWVCCNEHGAVRAVDIASSKLLPLEIRLPPCAGFPRSLLQTGESLWVYSSMGRCAGGAGSGSGNVFRVDVAGDAIGALEGPLKAGAGMGTLVFAGGRVWLNRGGVPSWVSSFAPDVPLPRFGTRWWAHWQYGAAIALLGALAWWGLRRRRNRELTPG